MQVRNHCFLHQYLILTLILTLEISLCLEWTYFNDFDLKITIQIVPLWNPIWGWSSTKILPVGQYSLVPSLSQVIAESVF